MRAKFCPVPALVAVLIAGCERRSRRQVNIFGRSLGRPAASSAWRYTTSARVTPGETIIQSTTLCLLRTQESGYRMAQALRFNDSPTVEGRRLSHDAR
jgi:hypothetical protein